jgi:uncharacterized Zn finger protein (UPF0148 family)
MKKSIICECGAKVSKKFCPECGKSVYKEIELPKKELPKKELPKEKPLKKFDDINEKSFSTLEPDEGEMMKRDVIQDKLEKLKEKMSNKLKAERVNDKQIK